MSIFLHEKLYRSSEVLEQFRQFPIAICGAGALGANLTENLVRSGFGNLKVIDRDRIEERNLSTQPYYRSDVGAFKAKILANSLYRAIGVQIQVEPKELTASNVKQLFSKAGLIIDAFDNSIARQIVTDYCLNLNLPCLHVGLSSDYAEVIWNEQYRVPSDVNDDVCDYPLARNLVVLTIGVASEMIMKYIATKEQLSYTITLKDFSIQPFED